VLGQKPLLLSGERATDCKDVGQGTCYPLSPTIGILGTPVGEITGTSPNTTGTLYAVAESESGHPPTAQFYHRIWALDISSLSPVTNGNGIQICASGCGGQTSTDFSQTHIQRPGLLWLSAGQTGDSKNRVYAAFSMMDAATGNPNGWIWSFDAHNLSTAPLSYETTPDSPSRRGGIWQGAAGLAAGLDSSKGSTYIYFSTGDGDFNLDSTGGKNAGDSFVKLSPSLPQIPNDSFTPSDVCWRQNQDKDFGSGGTMLLPDGTHPNYPYVAIKSEKLNGLWVMKRGGLGGFHLGGCPRVSDCMNPGSTLLWCDPRFFANGNIQTLLIANPNEARSTPAFWSGNTSSSVKGWVYFAASYDTLQAYPVGTNCSGGEPVLCQPAFHSPHALGYSATPSVSSNGSNNGIVWAIRGDSTSAYGLYAYDATNLNELWNSHQCLDTNGVPRDQAGQPTKFDVPTIANGYVYIGTQTDLAIYGQVPLRSCN